LEADDFCADDFAADDESASNSFLTDLVGLKESAFRGGLSFSYLDFDVPNTHRNRPKGISVPA